MAKNYTSQYRLCQWEPEDPVKRTDFNEDNQKIEAALLQLKARIDTQVEKRLAAMESQLPSLQGNVYDLLLNRYYSGENLSSRKMLFLDGLKDQSLIAAVTPGICYDPSIRRPKIYTAGAQSGTTTYSVNVGDVGNSGSDAYHCRWIGSVGSSHTATVTFTPSGYGTLTSISMRLSKSSSSTENLTAQLKIFDGDTLVGASQISTVYSNAYADISFSFGSGVFLAPKEYTLQIENVNHAYYLRAAYTSQSSGKLGMACTYTPLNCTSGTLTSVETDLGRSYTGALAWVRHIGGSAGVALKSGGVTAVLSRISVQPFATYKGEACTESIFRLPEPSTALSRRTSVQLTLNADSSGCILCDYGVAFY